jgi:branched-chain amino acid transport system permease protein
MDAFIAALLLQDGVAIGAIYVLMALGIVLIFNVTRIAFVPFGDFVAYAALTLASLQQQRLPGTVWLVATLAALALIMEIAGRLRNPGRPWPWRSIAAYGVAPLIPVALTMLLWDIELPFLAQIALTCALVLPIGPLLYRIVFRPIVDAPILTLLMVAVALHFALSGLALLYFGPEGMRTQPYTSGQISLGSLEIGTQTGIIVGCSILLSVLLFLGFRFTLTGKALRATAINRVGARLVGIRTTNAGALAFLLASGIGAVAGILIGPVTTIYYDTGFLVGLKGFVAAVVGGFVSYPLAAVGGILIGLIESFASFYASALKEVIVFTLILPVLMWRWFIAKPSDEEEEEASP